MSSKEGRGVPAQPDLAFLHAILGDLDAVRTAWVPTITEDQIRRDSPIIRRLVVYGDLGRAWRMAGFEREPIIPCFTLKACLAIAPMRDFRFALAGGGARGPARGGGFIECAGTISDEDRARLSSGTPVEALSFSQFRNGQCIVVNGKPITRQELIKYVAHKLGGAHYDPSRDSVDDDVARRLDSIRSTYQNKLAGRLGGMEVLETDPVLFELLSHGQAIASAPDALRLADRIREMLATL